MKRKVRDMLGLQAPLGLAPKTQKTHPWYVPPKAPISKRWKAEFRALKRFLKREGHARVPDKYHADPTLGAWVTKQRRAYHWEQCRKVAGNRAFAGSSHDRISDEQVSLLSSVGFEWEVGRTLALRRWRDKFALLQRFFRKNQHSRVPQSLNTDEYPRLGQWVRTQRTAYRNEQKRSADEEPKGNHRLSKWQMAKLRSVVFEYDVREAVWQENFAMLKDFEQWEGHTRVPVSLDSDRYPKLGMWVARQRNAYRNMRRIAKGEQPSSNHRMTKEHIVILESIGFEWEVLGKPIPKIDPSEFEGMIV